MPSLNEIRQKYPQYHDMNDQEFADKFHAKFYSDIPKEEFYNKIGLEQKQPSVMEQYREQQKQMGENRSPLDTIRDLASGALTSIGQGGQAIGEQIEKVPGFEKLQKLAQEKTGFSMPRANIEEAFEPIGSPNKSLGGEFAKGIGSYAPYAAMGGAGLAGQLGAGFAHGAATTQPEEDRLLGKGRLSGGAQEALINALTHGAIKGIDKLRPSKLLRGNLSQEELQANLKSAEGTNTGLGDIIGSPMLKRQYENILTKIPFSGATKKMQETGQQVIGKGEKFLGKLLGDNSPEDVGEQLNEKLIHTFKNEVEPEKNAIYEKVNKIADENKLTPTTTKFAEALKRNKSALDNLTLLRGDPLNNALFEKVAGTTGALEETTPKFSSGYAHVPGEAVAKTKKIKGQQGLSTSEIPIEDKLQLKSVGSSPSRNSQILGTPKAIVDPLTGKITQVPTYKNIQQGGMIEGEYPSNVDPLTGRLLNIPKFTKQQEQQGKGQRESYKNVNPITGQPELTPTINKVPVKNVSYGASRKTKGLGANALVEEERTTFRDANILKGALISAAKNAKKSPDPGQKALANVYNDLGHALRSDVHESISASKNPKLIHNYNKAEDYYQKHFSGFLDKDIYKYLQDTSKSDDFIQAFIKNSNTSDKAKQLKKLTDKLSDEDKKLLGYGYFSRALDNEGNLDPAKLATLVRKLKKNQLKTLVPDPVMRKEILNYNKLYGMNTKAVKMMANPETGQQALDVITTMVPKMMNGGFSLASLTGTPFMTKYLTNPKTREALIKAMLENKQMNKNVIPGAQIATQGTLNR